MSVFRFTSSDSGAPGGITNAAGSMLAVLDAVLVNGYGSLSPIGWTIAYTGTNLRTYRSNSGSQLYFGFDDTGTTTCRFRGGQTASAAGAAAASFTSPFPTDAQVSGGLHGDKSNGATARAWRVYSNGSIVYVLVETAGSGNFFAFAFGDLSTYFSSDTNCSIVQGGATAATCYLLAQSTIPATMQSGLYLSRKFDASTYSMPLAKLLINGTVAAVNASGFTAVCAYPDPATGGVVCSPAKCAEYYNSLSQDRGRLPGIWWIFHSQSQLAYSTGDTFAGATGTDMAGKTFEYVKMNISAQVGGAFFETSDTWDSVNFR